ncbi:MAG: hypothetical protein HYT82_01225, partial [Candidatus Harrisonbacteria bacterium]|nr:hypothetical protein [Candidatus Harrisonbacteria bacterium]
SPELILLPALANTLIMESCSRDAIAIARHPVRWMRRHVTKRTRDGAGKILRETPLLRSIARYLITVAKRFVARTPRLQRGSHANIARDAKRYLALRAKQHASDNELLAIMVFVEALGYMRKRHRPRTTSGQTERFPSMRPKNDGVYMNHTARG